MDITLKQYHFLKQLESRSAPAFLKELKPATPPAERSPLIKDGLVVQGKQKQSSTFGLSEKGRAWIEANPEPPKPAFPSVGQRVFLLRLAFMRPGASSAGMASTLKPIERTALEHEKWMTSRKLGKALSFELTDAGWEWVESHLTDPLVGKSPEIALGDALACIGGYLVANNLRLADLIRAKPAAASPAEHHREPPVVALVDGVPHGDIKAAIRDACLRIGNGRSRERLHLADLRKALGGWSRSAVDDALLELSISNPVHLVLEAIGDPRDIRAEDREAEFRTPSGEVRNLVYWIQT